MLGNLKMTLECTQAHERHVHYRVPSAVFLRLFKGFQQFLSLFEGFGGVWTDVVCHFKKSAEIWNIHQRFKEIWNIHQGFKEIIKLLRLFKEIWNI